MFDNFYLNIELVTEFSKMPTRAHSTDAGMDVYSPADYIINGNCDCLIPLGWKCEFPEGFALIVKEKSGRAVNDKIDVGACVIGETRIKTNKGFFLTKDLTKEFIKNNNILIMSRNIQKEINELKEFDGFRVSGNKKTIKVTFDNNKTLICSEDHRLFTKNRGWVKVKDITEDDIIAE